MWYKGIVLTGEQTGRTIGFPTVNLDPSIIPPDTRKGVYGARVKHKDTAYMGALYYGPRLVKNETHDVLEIHIIGFAKEIYGEEIEFQIEKYIRGVLNFISMELLKKQLQEDVSSILH